MSRELLSPDELYMRRQVTLAKYRAKHKEKLNAYTKQYHREHKETLAEKRKLYRANHSHKYAKYYAEYYAKKQQRTVKWDSEFTSFVTEEAHHLRGLRDRAFSFKWDVDHIIPLHGKIVSGLHVWNNLQVIPASVNRSKGNEYSVAK